MVADSLVILCFLASFQVDRVIPVQRPFYRVILDILPDGIQFVFITDDMFVIILLPDRRARRIQELVDAAG